MLIKLRKNKWLGQSTLEYAVLIIIVAAALLVMQIYVKRGLQGRFKSSGDDLGEQFSPTGNVTMITNSVSRTTERVTNGVTTSTIVADSSNRVTNVNLPEYGKDDLFWQHNTTP